MRDDRERLSDILEAIARIDKYAARGRAAFDQDELIQSWIIQHLGIIGEACRAMSDDFKSAHPKIPWRKIIGMRNILIHAYFGIDKDIAWTVVMSDLPDLKVRVSEILAGRG